MSPETYEQLLNDAASLCGIEPDFWDIWGRHHFTPQETKRAIVGSISGESAADADAIERFLAERSRREWQRLLPPAVVTGDPDRIELTLSVPANLGAQRLAIVVTREDGEKIRCEFQLRDLPDTDSAEIDGVTYTRKRVRIPGGLPLGYHNISATAGSLRGETRFIVTPERAYANPRIGEGGRAAGIAISVYGVRSNRNWGCGDFTDLLGVIDWVAEDLGAAFVGLNPLHAIHNRRPYNTSPYLPNCVFYQNFIYLDVEAIEDFALCRHAGELRRSPAVEAEITALRNAPLVEYERVAALKLRFLKICFARFLREWRAGSERAGRFRAFIDREGALLDKFATYCALDEYLHRRNPDLWIWTDWPAAYQDPNSAETRAFQQKHWRSLLFYKWVQWQIEIQLTRAKERTAERRMAIGLYHDLALATDKYGSDLWAHRPFFVAGCEVGSPPDDFSPNGQDWGFPPPSSDRHREDGYRLFAESIRKNCRNGGALRIDHVMRLFRLYWIPDGCDAAHGAYVRELTHDFLRILALESVRNEVMVVGEDLGTVEPEIREILARFGILSYRLFYFEKEKDGRFRKPDEYPQQALVSSTTHDLPTIAGFWLGSDIEARRTCGVLDEAGFASQWESRAREKQKMLDVLFQLNLMPAHLPHNAEAYPEMTGELHNAVVGFMALTPSQLLAINHEDLTKERSQQNLPGTTWQYPNWGRKMRFTLEQLRADPEARAYTAMFRNWIAHSGRKMA